MTDAEALDKPVEVVETPTESKPRKNDAPTQSVKVSQVYPSHDCEDVGEQVALRVRPLSAKERSERCRECVRSIDEEKQVNRRR